MSLSDEIYFEEKLDEWGKKLGVIYLNRPRALNALSKNMFVALKAQLLQWRDDNNIKAVLVKSNSDRAFCAGGDVRAVYDNREAPLADRMIYFELEYSINQIIFHYPKPYIAFCDGITMGGGVGISWHGSHCIATENVVWAMPETKIGLFPDVGASYHLSRLDYAFGGYLALTGNSVGLEEACAFGVIKYPVKQDDLADLESALISEPYCAQDKDIVTQLVNKYTFLPAVPDLYDKRVDIEVAFNQMNIQDVKRELMASGAWGKEIIEVISSRSPTSVNIVIEQMIKARSMTFDEVIEMDLALVKRCLEGRDFYEGVRAALIDKDHAPQWECPKLNLGE